MTSQKNNKLNILIYFVKTNRFLMKNCTFIRFQRLSINQINQKLKEKNSKKVTLRKRMKV